MESSTVAILAVIAGLIYGLVSNALLKSYNLYTARIVAVVVYLVFIYALVMTGTALLVVVMLMLVLLAFDLRIWKDVFQFK